MPLRPCPVQSRLVTPTPLLVVVNPRLLGQTLGGPPRSFRSKAALTGSRSEACEAGPHTQGTMLPPGSGLAEPSHSISHGAEIHHTRGLGENQKAGPGT